MARTQIKIYTLYGVIFLSVYSLFGQTDFEKYLKEQEDAIGLMIEDQNRYLENVTIEFDEYKVEQDRLLQAFKDDVEKKWGEFKTSSSKIYVDYDENLNARGSIDFEKGEIEIEVIVEDESDKSSVEKNNNGEEKLQKKLTQMVTKKADDKKPLLKDQLKNKHGQTVTKKNVRLFAKETVKDKKIKKEKFISKDGKKRIKYTIKVKLLPNHLETRASLFKKDVSKYSKRWKIDPAVTFAVMHTESTFNPNARSPVPAYGLMQLVPKTGARDAYNYVHKKDKLLTRKYLFVPEHNIELGCAYLSLIRYRYFSRIKNDESALYCTISAYNTGVGNVAKAFTGKTKLKATAAKVNTMNPEQVYKTLTKKLPYKETRKYLDNVTNRMDIYKSW
ncbi:MAG: DUF3393 domain-containing protein [Candidatus Marinimicrobia bacterium]|nr:DUF3393 domain-containing protein [Candidatus Neomarinimicrobiota bacterium]MBL7109334.1 DUF3393 domain-containing protein [Candidatus Neomarinimicrobiota bacterium]